ncbi:hypothetical protein QMK19_01340 [Streptomyces sp. H10-C2]|uniref:hypothetical protein n=1 Tax=unclassified Streptomyces TaxID=2593676 RepID=UPI0024BBDA35|nr:MULTISPECIES: hypothetical protein [unclassified Streptomyces]MDJ0340190.1 hypothetical protein [Streptomyces sp. PH10-H1]MDJ0368361.1 hypothetical protein [Streptomyces sp. H10-C2]
MAKELFALTERAGTETDVAFGPVSLLPNQYGSARVGAPGSRSRPVPNVVTPARPR